jgi:hypothetical protein
MSEWSGIDDDEDNADNQNASPPSSPFLAAFRTPRPPGIQTGVRDVPPALSEHPEDLSVSSLCVLQERRRVHYLLP